MDAIWLKTSRCCQYPYSLAVEDVEEQPSIIHAKALPVEEIYGMYGVKLAGRDIKEFVSAPVCRL